MATATRSTFPDFPLAELHAHLGTSISPSVLWQLAHEAGIKLPKKEFQDFKRFITLSKDRTQKLEDYFHEVYHPVLDRLSSGGHEVEHATYRTMSGAYHENGITLLELRNNPLKHNQEGLFELDHLIMSMLRGMERALLECSHLSAGLIFCMAREFSKEKNAIILDRAVKYRRRGVVGIDVAGPYAPGFRFKDYKPEFDRARAAGLGITVHSGEVASTDDMWEALEYANPARIGHGIRAAYDAPLMQELAKRGTVLEVCPMSNIATQAVENVDEMRFILRTLVENKVRFCINTDWPEIIEDCHLRSQYQFLLDEKMLTKEELIAANKTAFASSFIPTPGGLAAYL